MENINKGCVYFFRHIGLTPIKIGFSENESPINRFEQFKTYAPFGAELIGFIRTNKAKELESELHKKYARDRIKGEWFEITKEEACKSISFYSNINDIEEMNYFQIAWAKSFVYDKNEISNEQSMLKFFTFFSFENENCGIVFLNQNEISIQTGLDKNEISNIMKLNNIKLKSYRINGLVKKCYKIFKKRLLID